MKQRTFYLKKGEPIQKVIETIQKDGLIQNPEKSLFIIHEGLKSPGDLHLQVQSEIRFCQGGSTGFCEETESDAGCTGNPVPVFQFRT